MSRKLVPGSAGFTGSAVVHQLIDKTGSISSEDKVNYAGDLEPIRIVSDDPRYEPEQSNVCAPKVRRVPVQYPPDQVTVTSAGSAVDQSIDGPEEFIRINPFVKHALLDQAGELLLFTENTGYAPSSSCTASEAGVFKDLVTSVKDRLGHGMRYVVDARKIQYELNRGPQKTLEIGIRETGQWIRDNQAWCQRVQDENYQGEKLGDAV